MTRHHYDPLCDVCHCRPKMDRCGCCDECWYSGRYSRERELRTMTPAQRRRFEAPVPESALRELEGNE